MNLRKILGAVIFAVVLATGSTVYANTDIATICDYNQTAQENPDAKTINCLLTETALAYDVPPEIVKAVAEEESSWKQFDANGDTIVSSDGGIGIMQITNQSAYNEALLKNDVAYNIQAGVEVLNDMFARSDLPTVNNGDRDVIDNWYFAVMAYNGTKPVNSPFIQETGERNSAAYQERVFDNMEDYSLIGANRPDIDVDDITYNPASDENLIFVKDRYRSDQLGIRTKYQFETGETVEATMVLNIRPTPSTDKPSVGVVHTTDEVEIIGEFVYDETAPGINHFVWYPVQTADGTRGYVASSYLKQPIFHFTDVPSDHYAIGPIYYLIDRDLIAGVGNDKFGFGNALTREQAAILMLRVQNISTGNAPNPGFTDVPQDYKYYEAIAAAVDAEIFNGVSESRFAPQATMTRREMVVVLQNVFELPAAEMTHPFTDINATWYEDALNRLYAAGIVAGTSATNFPPKDTITREQFASFLARAMLEDYREER